LKAAFPSRDGWVNLVRRGIEAVTPVQNRILANALSALILLLMASDAYAYIDPGTGSLLVQGLLAALASAAAVVGVYWNRLKLFLGLKKPPPPEPPSGKDH
jgi:hypothetical protein